MKKVLVIGSLNMDMIVSVENIPQVGETVMASSIEECGGGKGANQAVACARFGAQTHMLGSIGNDSNGKVLKDNLDKEGIDTRGIKVQANDRTGMAWIVVDDGGSNSIVVIPGANSSLTRKDIDRNEEILNEADIILIQMEIPLDVVEYAVDKASKNGSLIILNPAPARVLTKDLLSKIDIITPNETELDILTKDSNLVTNYDKSKYLIGLGVKNVICTLGEKGALFVSNEEEILFSPYKVDAIDTTGAGDCFNGVLAAEISKGRHMEASIKNAIIASAISVTKKGAQVSMPKLQDIGHKL